MTQAELLEAARAAGIDSSSAQALRSQLEPIDFAQIATCLGVADDETRVGLLTLLDIGPPAASDEAKDVLSRALARLVRSTYPRKPGPFAFFQWRRLDKGAAEHFLLSEFDISLVGDDPLGRVVHAIAALGRTERVRCRLEEIRDNNASCAAEASQLLDSEFPTDARIAELQVAWTQHRSAENLVSLYYRFMAKKGEGGITKREVLRVFGKPDTASGSTIWYSPTEGTSLSWAFENGNVQGVHLT